MEGAKAVVCSVDYRLAPEHRFPAAHDDAYDALAYLATSPEAAARFHLDASRVAVGGTSAGANLAIAALVRLARDQPAHAEAVRLHLLIVPVVDNTATAATAWAANAETAPWLTPKRMLWYRRMYMPNEADWRSCKASPQRAPRDLLARLPPAWIAVSAEDVLAPEGIAFAAQLEGVNVPVALQVLEGCTHSILALNG